ncbi:acyl carrier protein [Leuconostoc suionicum]|uniref:acyl carrier protein n=1 Tax=Leuconostoc suionicum TaxID=1511761 RepID=UPI004035CEF6
MNNKDINQLKIIIVNQSPVLDDISEVKADTSLIEDAGIDSLSFIVLAIEIEKYFNIDIKMESELFEGDVKLSDLVLAVEKNMKK